MVLELGFPVLKDEPFFLGPLATPKWWNRPYIVLEQEQVFSTSTVPYPLGQALFWLRSECQRQRSSLGCTAEPLLVSEAGSTVDDQMHMGKIDCFLHVLPKVSLYSSTLGSVQPGWCQTAVLTP